MSNLLPEQTITPAGQPTRLLPPPSTIFTRQQERFQHLAQGHSLEPWLNRLATLSQAQQSALDALVAQPFDWREVMLPAAISVTPAILVKVATTYQGLVGAASWPSPGGPAPALSQDEIRLAVERNLLLAQARLSGSGPDLTAMLVAAAMQVVWTAAAQQANLVELNPAHSEFCPVCGCAAVGSIILAGEGRGGLRYQQCCLCATRWNVVRAHCTLCAEGSTVHYLSLEDQNPAVGAETCEHCHGYAKIYFQSKDINVDPVVDDLATLALDVLVGEEGFGRATPNLFLSEGESC